MHKFVVNQSQVNREAVKVSDPQTQKGLESSH